MGCLGPFLSSLASSHHLLLSLSVQLSSVCINLRCVVSKKKVSISTEMNDKTNIPHAQKTSYNVSWAISSLSPVVIVKMGGATSGYHGCCHNSDVQVTCLHIFVHMPHIQNFFF